MAKYFIERLTASKPDWEKAIIFAKGVEAFGVDPEKSEIRYIKDDGVIIVRVNGVQNPFDPYVAPRRTGPGQHDIDPGNPGSICDSEVHMHEEEIVRVEFITNSRRVQKTIVNQPPKPTILTAEGEDQTIAAEREQLQKEKEGTLKSV